MRRSEKGLPASARTSAWRSEPSGRRASSRPPMNADIPMNHSSRTRQRTRGTSEPRPGLEGHCTSSDGQRRGKPDSSFFLSRPIVG